MKNRAEKKVYAEYKRFICIQQIFACKRKSDLSCFSNLYFRSHKLGIFFQTFRKKMKEKTGCKQSDNFQLFMMYIWFKNKREDFIHN